MQPSHSQKSAIGIQFLAALKLRVEKRTIAKGIADGTHKDLTKARIEAAQLIAQQWLKDHNIKSPFVSAAEENNWYAGGRYDQLRITCRHTRIQFAFAEYKPALALVQMAKALVDSTKKRTDLCNEIVFLGEMQESHIVAKFQAYVCRLWSPETKDETLSDTLLRKHLQAFIDSLRPKTCPLTSVGSDD